MCHICWMRWYCCRQSLPAGRSPLTWQMEHLASCCSRTRLTGILMPSSTRIHTQLSLLPSHKKKTTLESRTHEYFTMSTSKSSQVLGASTACDRRLCRALSNQIKCLKRCHLSHCQSVCNLQHAMNCSFWIGYLRLALKTSRSEKTPPL